MKTTIKRVSYILLAFLVILSFSGCASRKNGGYISKTVDLNAVNMIQIEPILFQGQESLQDPEYVYQNTFEENCDAVDKAVDKIAKAYGVMGCSVAAFEKDRIVYTHSYGTARYDINTVTPASEDTKYRVASISKLVTKRMKMFFHY